jgi:hypothetical protein
MVYYPSDMPAKDTCFVADKAGPEVRSYFTKRRGGFLGGKDEIKGIERRYAVLGSFSLDWGEDSTSGLFSKVKKSRDRRNVFYVNLTDAKLYYARKGLLSKKPSLDESDFVEKIMDLPPKALEFLSDIMRGGSITYRELNKKHFLFLDGNPDMMMILRTRDLICVEPKFSGTEYAAKLEMPSLDSGRYNLGVLLETEEKELADSDKDAVKYKPEDILWHLEAVLQGKGGFSGLVYLPYDRCTYVDKDGRSRQVKLFAAKFKELP